MTNIPKQIYMAYKNIQLPFSDHAPYGFSGLRAGDTFVFFAYQAVLKLMVCLRFYSIKVRNSSKRSGLWLEPVTRA